MNLHHPVVNQPPAVRDVRPVACIAVFRPGFEDSQLVLVDHVGKLAHIVVGLTVNGSFPPSRKVSLTYWKLAGVYDRLFFR